MNEEELMGTTLFIARQAAVFLLGETGTLLPFSLTIGASGEQPETYFPSDSHTDATFQELLDAAVDHVSARATSELVAAVAVVMPLESDSESAMGIQVETRNSAVSLIYPYERRGDEWTLFEPDNLDGTLLPRLLESG